MLLTEGIIHIYVPWSCSVTSHCCHIEVCFRPPDGKEFPSGFVCCIFFIAFFTAYVISSPRPCLCSQLLNIHGPSLDSSSHSEIKQRHLLQCRKNEADVPLLPGYQKASSEELIAICMTLGAASLISPQIMHSDPDKSFTQCHDNRKYIFLF